MKDFIYVSKSVNTDKTSWCNALDFLKKGNVKPEWYIEREPNEDKVNESDAIVIFLDGGNGTYVGRETYNEIKDIMPDYLYILYKRKSDGSHRLYKVSNIEYLGGNNWNRYAKLEFGDACTDEFFDKHAITKLKDINLELSDSEITEGYTVTTISLNDYMLLSNEKFIQELNNLKTQ